MPKDHYASLRQRDAIRRAKTADPCLTKRRNGRRRKKKYTWKESWTTAIQNARNNRELTMIARSICVMHRAGKICEAQYTRLVFAGKAKRASLQTTK